MKYTLEFKLECIDKYKSTHSFIFPPGIKSKESFRSKIRYWTKLYDDLGVDGFVIVCRKTSEEEVVALVKRIEEYIPETNYSCSIGYSYHDECTIKLEDLLKESDKQMYSNKN